MTAQCCGFMCGLILAFGETWGAQTIVLLLAIVGALVPLLSSESRAATRWSAVVALGIGGAAWGGASLWFASVGKEIAGREAFEERLPSSRRDSGYVGSNACRSCHPGAYASWDASYHQSMTQVATAETVLAPFDGISLEEGNQRYLLEKEGDAFFVNIENRVPLPGSAVSWKRTGRERLGLTTGSHHMQVYWVVDAQGNAQYLFPYAYHITEGRWRPRESLFLRERGANAGTQVWNRSCYRCHSVGGQPRPDLQTGVAHTRVAELGIACEACHGPGGDHVHLMTNPLRRVEERNDDQMSHSIVNPERLDPKRSAQVCGSCHSVKWFEEGPELWEEGFAYLPGDDLDATTPVVRPSQVDSQPWIADLLERHPQLFEMQFWPDGMIRVAGREYNALVETECFQQGDMSCLSCHSMHDSDPNDQLIDRLVGDESCLQCHERYREDGASHTHHDPASSGSRCANCHMPHTTYGLLKATRSHQIRIPDIAAAREAGRPNACNLCHLDRTVSWAAEAMARWYGTPVPSFDADENEVVAGALWGLKGHAATRALVAAALGRAVEDAPSTGWRWGAVLAELMVDPYDAVRWIAIQSLRSVPEYEDISADYLANGPMALAAKAEVLRRMTTTATSERPESQPFPFSLENARGHERLRELLADRDNRPVFLVE